MHAWQAAGPNVRPQADELSPGCVHVWCASLEPEGPALDELAALLSPDERERASRFRFEKDRRRFVVARARLRILLGAYTRRSPAALVFSYGPYGKPTLSARAGCRDVRFNLSHSGELALFAIALGREVGVDLESIRPLSEMPGIVHRWFSAPERRRFHASPIRERSRVFFELWTRKEATVKGTGDGVSALADIDSGGRQPSPTVTSGCGAGPSVRWEVVGLEPGEGYVGAVAAEGGPFELSRWSWQPMDSAHR